MIKKSSSLTATEEKKDVLSGIDLLEQNHHPSKGVFFAHKKRGEKKSSQKQHKQQQYHHLFPPNPTHYHFPTNPTQNNGIIYPPNPTINPRWWFFPRIIANHLLSTCIPVEPVELDTPDLSEDYFWGKRPF